MALSGFQNNWFDSLAGEPFRRAIELMGAIRSGGYHALIVGGTVRDLILGEETKDIDIATDMPMDLLCSRFSCYDIGKSKQFGLVLVRHGATTFEMAQFRGPAPPGGEDSPAELFAADAALRDFTINALGLTEKGELLDPLGGLSDLEQRILRTPGRAEERLAEDVVRMLRAPRFAAQFGLTIEDSLKEAVRDNAARIGSAARERIAGEILKMAALTGERFAMALEEMDALGLLKEVLPEVHALKGLPQPPEWHPEGDAYVHTLAALRCNVSADPELNLAILCHDLGKAETYRPLHGRHTYHGHDRAGRAIVEGLARRLGLGKKTRERLGFVAGEHMRVKMLDEMKPSKVQRLIDDPAWPLLKSTAWCDCAAAGCPGRLADLEKDLEQAEKRAAVWQSRRERGIDSLLSGAEIMRLTGLPPGPEIGDLMRAVCEWAVDNDVTDRDRWKEFVKSHARRDQ